jgi:hypothetical protein
MFHSLCRVLELLPENLMNQLEASVQAFGRSIVRAVGLKFGWNPLFVKNGVVFVEEWMVSL